MSSVTLHKALPEARDWSDDLDEKGRWSPRRSLLFMATASVAFWGAVTFLIVH
jgi:hypothetical protein